MVSPNRSRSKNPTDDLEGIFGSARALEASELELARMLEARGIYFGDKLLPTYAFAFVSPQAQVDRWARQAELVVEAAEYHTQQLLAESMSCDTVSFSRDVLDIIYAYPGYQRACVLCRPDAIPQGADLQFVELNCDSPAMMMFVDVVAECILQLPPFQKVRERVKRVSAADRLLDTLLACYAEYGGRVRTPTIAITDWEGQKTRFEHARLAEHFQARGYETVICDPRQFSLVDGRLEVFGRQIHLVYRRALSAEIISRRASVAPLLTAYRTGAICMVNPLRSYIASAKSLLTRLTADQLPPHLQAAADHVPHTVLLDDPEMRAAVKEDRKQWALKRSEGHGGMHVVLPGVSSDKAWSEALQAASREVWIAQRYLDVPMLDVPCRDGDTIGLAKKYFNWNPFVFGGKFAAGLVRVSTTPLINITLGGGLMPTLAT